MENEVKENYGIVYALVNPAMPGLVKIGMSSKSEIDQRKNQLYFGCSGVPLPFECVYACKVRDFEKVEKALHIAFAPNRINPNREFFRVDVERVVALLELLGPNDARKDVEEDLDAGTTTQERSARESMRKRPSFDFGRMGIPIGAKLRYWGDENVEVEVVEGNKVRYEGEVMSLTAVTRLFKPYVVHPTPYWVYEGDRLSVLWENSLDGRCEDE